MEEPINQIDHVLVQTKYAKEVFNILSETLDLPIAWDSKSYAGIFVSGGISFGNINIEILNYAKIFKVLGLAPNREGIIGIAFEPNNSIEKTCEILDELKINHGKPKPFKGKVNGEKKVLWTNLFLKDILEKYQIFFCKYAFNQGDRRTKLNSELVEKKGGLIGIDYVKELVIGCSDEKTLSLWRNISKENKIEDDYISFEKGPEIKLIKSKKDSIISILIKVNSINKAKEALLKNKGIIIKDNNEIIIKTTEEQYLGLRLCD